MIETTTQAKALVRATEPVKRLDLLTDIELGVDCEQIIRFCENYRFFLGKSHREQLKKDVARILRLMSEAVIPSEDGCNEVDGKESEQ